MPQIIGFGGKFYTLWTYNNINNYYVDSYGNSYCTGGVTHYYYLKNISTDLEKVKELYPDLSINDELKGRYGSWEKAIKIELPAHLFPQGFWEEGNIIMESDNTTALWKLYLATSHHDSDKIIRHIVNARRRLINLGLLRRFEGRYSTPEYIDKIKAKRAINEAKNSLQSGWHFNVGDRISLSIKKLDSFAFDSAFGTTYVINYGSECGRLFKYMGGTPPDIDNQYVKVVATIKHDQYNEIPETKLQRIKIS